MNNHIVDDSLYEKNHKINTFVIKKCETSCKERFAQKIKIEKISCENGFARPKRTKEAFFAVFCRE